MKLLAIETSSKRGGVALLENRKVIAELSLELSQSTSVELLPAIETLLTSHSIHPADLDALAVSVGPGSYTGIRIGIATAQGMATAADLPVYEISSLAGLAIQVARDGTPIAVARQARKGEYFFCAFEGIRLEKELIPEGRYKKTEIIAELKRLGTPCRLLLEEGVLGLGSGEDSLRGEPVTAKASAIALLASEQPIEQAHPRGQDLQARHYSPGYRDA